ncbi:MAG: DUF3810 domain-containing protein [Phycisphaerales bacterium]|nr:DUF3810 domain-containing protein [Phycisphaerales bacterium]
MSHSAPATPASTFWRRNFVALVALAALAIAFVASLLPGFVDGPYARYISPTLIGALATLTNLAPFSVGELVLGALLLRGAWLFGRGSVRLLRRRVTLLAVLTVFFTRALRWLAVIGAVFYWTWGLNYARTPLVEVLGWQVHVAPREDHAAQADELTTLGEAAIAATNAAYREAFGTDDLDVPSAWPGSLADLDAAVDVALDRAIVDLGLPAAMQGRHGRSKVPLLSSLMSRMHVTGFFFPWTGEANLNGQQPACFRPHVVAHEKAHQRGLGPEDEVEFLAFAAGVRADHAYQRYSAYLYASVCLLRELNRVDAKASARLDGERPAGVRRDIDANSLFWTVRRGALTKITITINDTYLKSQGVKKGVQSYAASTALIVAYARARGGLVGGR